MTASLTTKSGDLSDAERRRRIAELLCRAILLAESKRAIALRPIVSDIDDGARATLPACEGDSDDERILNYLQIAGEGTPVTIRQSLGLSKSGAYRAFLRLLTSGHILTAGNTRALVYQLKAGEPTVEKIGLN